MVADEEVDHLEARKLDIVPLEVPRVTVLQYLVHLDDSVLHVVVVVVVGSSHLGDGLEVALDAPGVVGGLKGAFFFVILIGVYPSFLLVGLDGRKLVELSMNVVKEQVLLFDRDCPNVLVGLEPSFRVGFDFSKRPQHSTVHGGYHVTHFRCMEAI